MESVVQSPIEPTEQHQYTILIVEDDPSLRDGIHDLLEFVDGTVVYSVSNGLEAVEILDEITPDLFISDIMMPHMNGFQLLAEVRKIPKYVRIPFIFLSARGSKEEVFKGRTSGAELYITKPFDINVLVDMAMTQLQRASERKLANQEDISSLKRTVLQILNHEFRTPLTYVTAYYDMLADSIDSSKDGRNMDEYLNGILSGCERLIDLVEDLIMVMDVRGGKLAEIYETSAGRVTEFNQFVQDAIKMDAAVLEKYNIEVEFSPLDSDCVVWGVEDQIKVLFRHLIENAIKFTTYTAMLKKSGRVTVDLSVVEDGKFLEMVVTDTGIGFPEEVSQKILELFYQHNRQHYEQQGSGAGLTISEGITDIHNGTLQLNSVEENGCTTILRLPIHTEADIDEQSEKALKKKRIANILLVEDDEVLLEGLEALMDDPNPSYVIQYRSASSAEDALETLKSFTPDLIISDLVMPGMDGLELIQAVRQQNSLLHVPFIIVSGRNSEEDILLGRRAGAEEYITKPYDADELMTLVYVQLDRYFEHLGAADQDFDKFKQNILNMLQPEFLAPLGSVSEKSNMLAKQQETITTADDLRLALGDIQSGSEMISSLVEDFMSLAEIETGEANKAFDSRANNCFDFSYLVSDAFKAHSAAFEHNEIEATQILATDGYGAQIEHTNMQKALARLVGIVTSLCIEAKGSRVAIEVTRGITKNITISVWHNGSNLDEMEKENISEVLQNKESNEFNPMDFSSHYRIVNGFVKIHGGMFFLVDGNDESFDKFVISLPAIDPPTNFNLNTSGFKLQ